MAKAKNMESWGRETARKRYAHGGEVEVNTGSDSPIEAEPASRTAEIDEFISQVMQDQIKKMKDD